MAFVFNGFVRGESFIGRQLEINRIMENVGKPTWILGNRRVGKTSLLRQVEYLCRESDDHVALYWDLQGSQTLEGLKDNFLEALDDAEDVCERLGIDVEAWEDLAMTEILGKLRRRVKANKDLKIFLMMDECEELVDIAASDIGILAALRKMTHCSQNFSLLMAGSLQLLELDESQSRTSPFLPDFLPPLPLGPFSWEEARSLLSQEGVEEETARRIYQMSFGNPHLLQVLGEYHCRLNDQDKILRELRQNRVCKAFFDSNFRCLPAEMGAWWDSGQAVEKLKTLKPGESYFQYARQSAMVRLGEQGQIEVSPLLMMVESGEDPQWQVVSEPVDAVGEEKAVPVQKIVERPTLRTQSYLREALAVAEALRGREQVLHALPHAYWEDRDENALRECANQPGFRLMERVDCSADAMHRILDGASPEFVLDKPGDQRTHVFLVGAVLFRLLSGHHLFSEISDPESRAAELVEHPARIEPDPDWNGSKRKAAMIAMRCLHVEPSLRYEDLEHLIRDLEAI